MMRFGPILLCALVAFPAAAAVPLPELAVVPPAPPALDPETFSHVLGATSGPEANKSPDPGPWTDGEADAAGDQPDHSAADEEAYEKEIEKRTAVNVLFSTDRILDAFVFEVIRNDDGTSAFRIVANLDGCLTLLTVNHEGIRVPKVPELVAKEILGRFLRLEANVFQFDICAQKLTQDIRLSENLSRQEFYGGALSARAGTYVGLKVWKVHHYMEAYLQGSIAVSGSAAMGRPVVCPNGVPDNDVVADVDYRLEAIFFFGGRASFEDINATVPLGHTTVHQTERRKACTFGFESMHTSATLTPSVGLLNAWREGGILDALGLAEPVPPGFSVSLDDPQVRAALGIPSAPTVPGLGPHATGTGGPCSARVEPPPAPGVGQPAAAVVDRCSEDPLDVRASAGAQQAHDPLAPVLKDNSAAATAYEARKTPGLSVADGALQDPRVNEAIAWSTDPADTSQEAVMRRATRGVSWVRNVLDLRNVTSYRVQTADPCSITLYGVLKALPNCDPQAFTFEDPHVTLQGNEIAIWQFDQRDAERMLPPGRQVFDGAATPDRHPGRVDGAAVANGRFREAYYYGGQLQQADRIYIENAPTPSGEFTLFLWIKPGCDLGLDCNRNQFLADWRLWGDLFLDGSMLVAAGHGHELRLDVAPCWRKGTWTPALWSHVGGADRLSYGTCTILGTSEGRFDGLADLSLGAGLSREQGFRGVIDEVYIWQGTPATTAQAVLQGLASYRSVPPPPKGVRVQPAVNLSNPNAALDAVQIEIPEPPWDASDVTAFRIYRSQSRDERGVLVAEVPWRLQPGAPVPPAVWNDPGVRYGERYYYRVAAKTPWWEGDLTPPFEVTAGFVRREVPNVSYHSERQEVDLSTIHARTGPGGVTVPPVVVKTYENAAGQYCAEWFVFQQGSPAVCDGSGLGKKAAQTARLPVQEWRPAVSGSTSAALDVEVFYQYDPARVRRVSASALGSTINVPLPAGIEDLEWWIAHPNQTAITFRVTVRDPDHAALDQSHEFNVPFLGQVLALKDEAVLDSPQLDTVLTTLGKTADEQVAFAESQLDLEESAEILRPVGTTPRSRTSTVWDGQRAYVFGGENGAPLNQVLRYDPKANRIETLNGVLPSARTFTGAALVDGNAYVFGGRTGNLILDQIVRFDLATATASVMGARLPTPKYAMTAVSDGRNIYLLGGCTAAACSMREILKYDPATDTVRTALAELPTHPGTIPTLAAVWDGSFVDIFGGCPPGPHCVDQAVHRYNPTLDTMTLGPLLPSPQWSGSAIWDGRTALLFGGCSPDACPTSRILRYNPATNLVTATELTMPDGGSLNANALWDGEFAYILFGSANAWRDTVVRYRPTPSWIPPLPRNAFVTVDQAKYVASQIQAVLAGPTATVLGTVQGLVGTASSQACVMATSSIVIRPSCAVFGNGRMVTFDGSSTVPIYVFSNLFGLVRTCGGVVTLCTPVPTVPGEWLVAVGDPQLPIGTYTVVLVGHAL